MEPTLEEVKGWAMEAGKMLRQGLSHKHEIRHKGAIDLVTEMDGRSEQLLIEKIRSSFPKDKIISEESGDLGGEGGHCWYIDPLDGTTNYAHGVPYFNVSIGYVVDGRPTLGVVYEPVRRECFSAKRGEGAWLNRKRIHASEATELIQSLLVTGFPYEQNEIFELNMRSFDHMVRLTQGVRRCGSAALDLCYTACGRFDGYWERGLKPWDIAAGAVIAEEAGIRLSDMEGNVNYFKPPFSLVGANPALYPKLLKEIGAVLAH
jgi:myo-inositol-1(or 4)-monophosphatase